MKENFLSDKPVSEEKEDKFQRYTFSKRIAQAIINRTNTESIVVGLYGAWGEGKTSVLNFIKQELKSSEPNVIHFTFNPWPFTDESTLLTSFFNTLASELEKKIESNPSSNETPSNEKRSWWRKAKKPLKTNTETIGEMIIKYGKLASISKMFGVSGANTAEANIAEVIVKSMLTVRIGELKEIIEQRLADSQKRVVIFIDDIDRLEKNEIQAIFRLVKHTGNFAYITYLLSFDENIVSSAIGERFGAGDQKAGFHFLEKIIQIPIKLPLASKNALENYCFNLVQQSLNDSQIFLTEHEFQEFALEFSSGFLIRLTTPHLAIKYGNALSFSLPLLKGEVNYVDLLLIEAVRVFYPELYEFIRAQPDYFIGVYFDKYSKKTDAEKIKKFNELFAEKTVSYSLDEIACAKYVLGSLFPNLGEVWGLFGLHCGDSEPDEKSRYNQKRVSATQYFNRYFSYTVIEGDISDVAVP
ncbi:MAG TPA: hypothetical protein DD638_00155 [Pasteurellaceae bacterium]|nr:hypothetical protein [Pasteurellaceae bacterium]